PTFANRWQRHMAGDGLDGQLLGCVVGRTSQLGLSRDCMMKARGDAGLLLFGGRREITGTGASAGAFSWMEKAPIRRMRIHVVAAVALWASCTPALAQTTLPKDADRPGAACPPGAQNGPTVGRDSGQPLSDQLARSKGVICP